MGKGMWEDTPATLTTNTSPTAKGQLNTKMALPGRELGSTDRKFTQNVSRIPRDALEWL